jgi:ATP-binding cassette, subfamily C, bacteriocin exporter
VNGKDWNSFSTRAWRTHVAIVEQHVQLFNGNILENISLEEKPNIKKIITFCQVYGFHDFIMEFQQGYVTIVNENSSNLSGGQRQLIAMARAVYSQPRLLLLDEATAAMGKKTERFVLELLNRLKKEMPVIFVTHHPQTARYADQTYVIETGTVSALEKT